MNLLHSQRLPECISCRLNALHLDGESTVAKRYSEFMDLTVEDKPLASELSHHIDKVEGTDNWQQMDQEHASQN